MPRCEYDPIAPHDYQPVDHWRDDRWNWTLLLCACGSRITQKTERASARRPSPLIRIDQRERR